MDEVDAWQDVTAGTMVVGTAESVASSYSTVYYIEMAYTEAAATDGAEILVEVSYADDNWVLLTTFKGTAETPATTTTVGAVTDANSVIDLTDSATGDFDVVGRKWFIKDGTIGNSETVRTKSNATHVVTLCSGPIRSHDSGVNVYDRVDEWVVSIPMGAAYVRVSCNNVDADCDCAFTSRKSIVTAIQ
jgi:fructose-specific component phosphotransferase system IIB-like protein